MAIHQLVYISSATEETTAECCREIASKAAAYNQSINVTGILLLYNETIIQFLEGEEKDVRSLYDRISTDRRHKNIIVLLDESREDREFPTWSMGFHNLEHFEDKDYLFTVQADAIDDQLPEKASQKTQLLIKAFKRASGLVVD